MSSFANSLKRAKDDLVSYLILKSPPKGVVEFRRKSISIILSFYIVAIFGVTLSLKIFDPTLSLNDLKLTLVIVMLCGVIYALRWMKSFFFLWLFLTILFYVNITAIGILDGSGIFVTTLSFAVIMPIQGTYFTGRAGAIGGWVAGVITITVLTLYSLRHPPPMTHTDGLYHIFDISLTLGGALTLSMIIALTLHNALLQSLHLSQNNLERARAADQERTRFFGTVSHEVRNALNGIFGITAGLQRQDLSPDVRKQIDLIQASGNSLIRTLNDTLEITRLETGNLDIIQKPTDVASLIRTLAARWQLTANDKGLVLNHTIASHLPQWVALDEGRIIQILDNLISNAMKFTPNGSISLDLTCTRDADDEMELNFRVTDTGIGINPGRIERVFEPYRQGTDSTFAKYGGTGLGLYICRLLATQMHGSISIENSSEAGTTFLLTIPTRLITEEELQNDIKPQIAPDAGLHVLAVDDSLPNLRYLETLLTSWEIGFEGLSSGMDCLVRLEKGGVDLLLLDVNMPEMSGLELLRRIRMLPRPLSDLDIIVISADGRESIRRAFEALNAASFLVKPLTPDVLRNALIDILRQRVTQTS